MKMETLKSKKYLIWLSVILAFFAISFAISTSNIANGQDCNVKAIGTEAELNAAIEAGGTFALVSDVEITSTKDIVAKDASYEFDLDLAGFSLVANGNFRMFNIANNNGAQITIESNQNGALNGAGVAVANNTGSVNISGVTLQNCTAETGAALSLKDASAALNNVVINGCSASAYGSAIYCADNNSAINTYLKLANATITNNAGGLGAVYVDTNSAAIPNVTLSGTNTITGNDADIYVPSFKNFKFNLVGSLLNSKIGISTDDVIAEGEEITFTAGFASNSNGANPSDVFTSNNSNYKVVWNANNNEAALSTTEKSAMYSVEFETDGNGIINSVSNSYKAGQVVEVYTSANAGYKFEKLTVNGEDVFASSFTMPSSNTTVVACFSEINDFTLVTVTMPLSDMGCAYSGEIPDGWQDEDFDGNYTKAFPRATKCDAVTSEWDCDKLFFDEKKCSALYVTGNGIGIYLFEIEQPDGVRIMGTFGTIEGTIYVIDNNRNPVSDFNISLYDVDTSLTCVKTHAFVTDTEGKVATGPIPLGLFGSKIIVAQKNGYFTCCGELDWNETIELITSEIPGSLGDDYLLTTYSSMNNKTWGSVLGASYLDDIPDMKGNNIDCISDIGSCVQWLSKDDENYLLVTKDESVIYGVAIEIGSGISPKVFPYRFDSNGVKEWLKVNDKYQLGNEDTIYFTTLPGPGGSELSELNKTSAISLYTKNKEYKIKVSHTENDYTQEYSELLLDYLVQPGTTFKLEDGVIKYSGTYTVPCPADYNSNDDIITEGIISSEDDALTIKEAILTDVINNETHNLKEESFKIDEDEEGARVYDLELKFESAEPTTYSITCEDAEHGKITADVASAAAGDVVTLTATPDEGYELDTVSSDQVAIENMSFEMPDEDVVISATFKEAEAPQPEPGHETEDVNGSAQTGDMTGSYVLGIAVLFIASLGLCLGRKKYFNVK